MITLCKRIALCVLIAALLITSFTAANAGETNEAAVDIIQSDGTETVDITVGVSEELPLGKTSNSLSTSNKSVVAVDEGNYISARKKGVAVITETDPDGNEVKKYRITVKKLAKTISLTDKRVTMGVGEKYKLSFKIPSDTAAYDVYYDKILGNGDGAISVSEDGTVTAKKVGSAEAICTIRANDASDICEIIVKPKSTKVAFKQKSLTIGIGEKYTLKALVPAGTATCEKTFSSSDTEVVSVDKASGRITAKKKGTASVKCRLKNGKKATCKITVKKPAKSVSFKKKKITLNAGEVRKSGITFPKNTASLLIKCTSGNTAKVQISQDGSQIFANRPGTALITCKLKNGKKATCRVTVRKPKTTQEKTAAAKRVAKRIAKNALKIAKNRTSKPKDIEVVSIAAELVAEYCDMCVYTTKDPDYPTAYGVFVKGVYTCAGSARAMGMVLGYLSFKWKHVNENQWSHQWCELKMDGKKGWADGYNGRWVDGPSSAIGAGYGSYSSGKRLKVFENSDNGIITESTSKREVISLYNHWMIYYGLCDSVTSVLDYKKDKASVYHDDEKYYEQKGTKITRLLYTNNSEL